MSRLRRGVHLRQQTQISRSLSYSCPKCYLLSSTKPLYSSYTPSPTHSQNKTHRSTRHANQTTCLRAQAHKKQEQRKYFIRPRKRRRNDCPRSTVSPACIRLLPFHSKLDCCKTKGTTSQGLLKKYAFQRGCGVHVFGSINFVLSTSFQAEKHVAPRLWKITIKLGSHEAVCPAQGQSHDREEG